MKHLYMCISPIIKISLGPLKKKNLMKTNIFSSPGILGPAEPFTILVLCLEKLKFTNAHLTFVKTAIKILKNRISEICILVL